MWCPKCHGDGFVSKGDCRQCKGKRTIFPTINLDVEIEKGKRNEDDVTFKTYAGVRNPVEKPGDMHFQIIEN